MLHTWYWNCYFWRVQASCFKKCLIFWTYLIILLHNSLDAGSAFTVGILHWWCGLFHNRQAHTTFDCLILCDDRFDYYVKVVSTGFLHWKVSFIPLYFVGNLWCNIYEYLDPQQAFPIGFSIHGWSLPEWIIALLLVGWLISPHSVIPTLAFFCKENIFSTLCSHLSFFFFWFLLVILFLNNKSHVKSKPETAFKRQQEIIVGHNWATSLSLFTFFFLFFFIIYFFFL